VSVVGTIIECVNCKARTLSESATTITCASCHNDLQQDIRELRAENERLRNEVVRHRLIVSLAVKLADQVGQIGDDPAAWEHVPDPDIIDSIKVAVAAARASRRRVS